MQVNSATTTNESNVTTTDKDRGRLNATLYYRIFAGVRKWD